MKVLACLLGAVSLGLVGTLHADEEIDLDGTFVECLGAASGRNYDITNKTGETIFDITVSIWKLGGGDPGAKLWFLWQQDYGDPDFDVDDDLNGIINPITEDDDVVDPPATTARMAVPTGGPGIPDNNVDAFDLDISLTGTTNGMWCIALQPTDKTGKAIGKGLADGLGTSNRYSVELTPEAASIAPYTGISFNDVNDTGQAITAVGLMDNGDFIARAYQKDANGDEIPGSNYDSTTGILVLAAPVANGEKIYIGVDIAQGDFFGGGAMMIDVFPNPIRANCNWRCGLGVNPDTFLVITDPVLGGVFSSSVVPHAGSVLAALSAYATPAQLNTQWGELLVNIADPGGELLGVPVSFGNPAVFAMGVPLDAALYGFTFSVQALHLGGVNPPQLACAYDCVIGF